MCEHKWSEWKTTHVEVLDGNWFAIYYEERKCLKCGKVEKRQHVALL